MSPYDLDETRLKALRKLNVRLQKLQDRLIKEAVALDTALMARKEDPGDTLDDYEIELVLHFHLREDDADYDPEDDNILTGICEYLTRISANIKERPWRWEADHNEFRGRPEHPMRSDRHCWWFHALYDHNDLSYEEMLRIGLIWSDLKVRYQYFDEEN